MLPVVAHLEHLVCVVWCAVSVLGAAFCLVVFSWVKFVVFGLQVCLASVGPTEWASFRHRSGHSSGHSSETASPIQASRWGIALGGKTIVFHVCRPQGEPILESGCENITGLCTVVLETFFSHLAKSVAILKGCNPMKVALRFRQPWPQTLVSTKKLDLMVLSALPPSQRSVSN